MAGWAVPAVAVLLGAVEVQAAPVTDITVKNVRTAPTATCAAAATVQNPFSGAYSLTFTTQ